MNQTFPNKAKSSLKGKRVAIIGAGSAGTVAAKEVREVESACQITIFERRSEIGGIWQYDPNPGNCILKYDSRGQAFALSDSANRTYPVGPMYDGLRTNIASDLMTFRDSPFAENIALFPSRKEVNDYLQTWSEQQNLNGLIRFDTRVTEVRRVRDGSESEDGQGSLWKVDSQGLINGKGRSEEFDFIIVASGRCNDPLIPFIPGLWNFQGETLHSAFYRDPLKFRNKSILILGNSSSGMDIARESVGKIVREFPGSEEWIKDSSESKTGIKVRQSIRDITKPPGLDYDPRDPESPEWCHRIQVVPRITKIEPSEPQDRSKIFLENGEILKDVDVIVFGTGYLYSFPFIDHETEPFKSFPILRPSEDLEWNPDATLKEVLQQKQEGQPFQLQRGRRVAPAMSNLDDWQLFYRADKSLIFLGVPTRIVPFPMAQAQARYAASFWNGQAKALPFLRDEIPPSDPERWVSYSSTPSKAFDHSPSSHVFGSPSDKAYMDALYSFIDVPGAGQRPSWDVDMQEALENDRFDKGAKAPRGKEGLGSTPIWRLLRRQNGKTLRREALGY